MADRCWRCAGEVDPTDRFCPTCGAAVREDALDTGRPPVADDTPPATAEVAQSRSSPWVLAVGVALVAAVVGFFALTSPNDDDPPSADPSGLDRTDDLVESRAGTDAETTDDLSGIELTAPLEWVVDPAEIEGAPVAMIDHDGSLFVYRSSTPFRWFGEVGSVEISERRPDGTWVEHGSLTDDDAEVTRIVASTDGMIAVGLDGDERPTVWRSSDGVAWQSETLPSVSLGDVRLAPSNVIEHDGVVLVAGRRTQPWTIIGQEIRDRYRDVAPDLAPTWSSTDDEVIVVRGPLGIVLDEIPLSELGLDADDMRGAPESEPAPVWIFDDGAWTSDILGGAVASLAAVPGEPGILAMVDTGGAVDALRLEDGGWSELAGSEQSWNLSAAPGGTGYLSLDERHILVRDDELDVVRRISLTASGESAVSNWAAEPDGVAAVISTWAATIEQTPRQLVLLRDGYRLEIVDNLLQLSDETGVVVQSNVHSSEGLSGHRYDLTAGSFTFVDPATGDDLVTFALGELRELDEGRYPPVGPGPQQLTVLFSADLDRWFGGPLDLEVDGRALVVVDVGADVVRMAIVEGDDLRRPTGGAPAISFTLVEATIPGG